MNNILGFLLVFFKYFAFTTLILLALYLFFTIVNFIESKTERNKLKKYDVVSKQLDATNAFFALIDYLIENEIEKILSSCKLLSHKYEIVNMDDDYEKISKAVYGAIKSSLIEHDGVALDKGYVLQYIVNRSQLLFFNTVMEFNRSFR